MILIYISLLSTVVFWGSAFVGIRLGLEDYSPLSLALFRAMVATVCSLILYLKNKELFAKTQKKDRLKAFFLGMLGMGIYSYALALGERTVPAGIAAFVVGQMPLLAAVFAALFLKEKIQPRLWMGILISICGLGLISISGLGSFKMQSGLLFVMISALCGASYTCLQKPLLKRMHTLNFTCHAIWGSTSLLALLALWTKNPLFWEINKASLTSTFSVIYLGFFPSLIAYLGWAYAVSKMNIAKAGLLLYGMPLIGGFLSWLMLSEQPQPLALLGMALAFLGCLVGSIKFKAKAKPIRVITN